MVGEVCKQTSCIHKELEEHGENENLSRLVESRAGGEVTRALKGLQDVILCFS